LEKGSPAAARPTEQVVPSAKPAEKETEEDEEDDDFELFGDDEVMHLLNEHLHFFCY